MPPLLSLELHCPACKYETTHPDMSLQPPRAPPRTASSNVVTQLLCSSALANSSAPASPMVLYCMQVSISQALLSSSCMYLHIHGRQQGVIATDALKQFRLHAGQCRHQRGCTRQLQCSHQLRVHTPTNSLTTTISTGNSHPAGSYEVKCRGPHEHETIRGPAMNSKWDSLFSKL